VAVPPRSPARAAPIAHAINGGAPDRHQSPPTSWGALATGELRRHGRRPLRCLAAPPASGARRASPRAWRVRLNWWRDGTT